MSEAFFVLLVRGRRIQMLISRQRGCRQCHSLLVLMKSAVPAFPFLERPQTTVYPAHSQVESGLKLESMQGLHLGKLAVALGLPCPLVQSPAAPKRPDFLSSLSSRDYILLWVLRSQGGLQVQGI
ncbi:uncharacterized protein EI97DRAFT_124064 [Westerdykella ornata]|uniref:Uncharacterized protein n=1 Tax=Westerdykella ornata TaxID=318751 RepID=A0A6A6JW71_WESOR|nr:uncharacterized protein EI97DRAFT_124064 [Westerdykella ornata]KAF2280475.1 hypothetical protein EI97DRAFT_124064 [Westerdykella ornata]